MKLEYAIRTGDQEALKNLLLDGADPNRPEPEGLTPLMIASGIGEPRIVELLLAAKANVLTTEPQMGATALHKAVQSGNADVVGMLLDHGAFIDQQTPVLGNTPLIDAVLYRTTEAVRILLARGARTGIRNHWHQSPLDLAQEDGLEAIIGLIEARDEDDRQQLRAMPLIAAVKSGDANEVERLIRGGSPLNERTPMTGSIDDGYTPLGLATRDGHLNIVRILLDGGADINRTIGLYRGTPIHEAAYFGHIDILALFIDTLETREAPKAELDALGSYNGMTALHDAVWQGHAAAVRMLGEAGARLDLRSHAGRTPYEAAQAYGFDGIAHELAGAERR